MPQAPIDPTGEATPPLVDPNVPTEPRIPFLPVGPPPSRSAMSRTVAPRVCAHHPDRPAHALCVGCRSPLCSGCATSWEGINLCATCLAARRRGHEEATGWRVVYGYLGLVFGIVTAAVTATLLRAWIGALLARLE